MREIREPHVRHCHRNVRAQRRREQHGHHQLGDGGDAGTQHVHAEEQRDDQRRGQACRQRGQAEQLRRGQRVRGDVEHQKTQDIGDDATEHGRQQRADLLVLAARVIAGRAGQQLRHQRERASQATDQRGEPQSGARDADADAGHRHDPQTDDIARAESGQMNRVQ